MGHFKLNNYLLQEDAGAVFCSPFRRRRQLAKAVSPGEVYLSREEAWALYLAKLEEEANYFSVGDSVEPDSDICTCHTCIVSMMTLRHLEADISFVSVISRSPLIHDDAYLNIL